MRIPSIALRIVPWSCSTALCIVLWSCSTYLRWYACGYQYLTIFEEVDLQSTRGFQREVMLTLWIRASIIRY